MRPVLGGLLLFLAFGANAQAPASPLAAVNEKLAADGENFRMAYAEFITAGESGNLGNIVFFDKQCGKGAGSCNKQLSSDWVPGDPRRTGTNDIYVLVDDVDVTQKLNPNNTLAPGADLAAFHTVNQTWEDVTCSNISIIDLGNSNGTDIGLVQFLLGFGGEFEIRADLTHAGMLPPSFFDAIAPGGGGFILGVTFTFVFTDSDIDNNGKFDTAFREIYYNDIFPWQDNPNDRTFDGSIDLESVALHEMGHGLSQAHFGKGFFQDRNKDGIIPSGPEDVITSPTAVMNAAHTVAGLEITGTDLGGHCSNWAEWPNR